MNLPKVFSLWKSKFLCFQNNHYLGHNNIVDITGSVLSSDDSLRELDPAIRDCHFEDETSDLRLHKNYTQSNCFFECFLFKAQQLTKEKFNQTQTCFPWFFPTTDEYFNTCNPWEAEYLLEQFTSISTLECQHCLPDCTATVYKYRVGTSFKFLQYHKNHECLKW